ncbi:MAG: hypothetical protein IKJ34_01910, partial [Mailhella sp.]|nr:hypothetical protein [Mailhella sp.]
MNISLRSKLVLLVFLSICLAALPIIFFSRDYLLESSLEKERTSFINTVKLVEDSISVRYLNMLSVEVETVRIVKDDLHTTNALFRKLLLQEAVSVDSILFKQFSEMLHEWDYHIAFFDLNGNVVWADPLIRQATAPSQKDFKGQAISSKVIARPGNTKDLFTVVNIDMYGSKLPVLLCFTPVPGKGMLVLSTPVDKIVLGRLQTEKGMISSIAERIDDLEINPGVSIAIMAADGTSVASKGHSISLADIAENSLAEVRKKGNLAG